MKFASNEKKFMLYATHGGRYGYCQKCIDHGNLSKHMIGDKSMLCPLCEGRIDAYQEKAE